MKSVLPFIVVTAALTLAGCKTPPPLTQPEQPAPNRSMEWLWSEPVEFLEYHDPMTLWLGDGTKVEVILDRDSISEVKWKDVAGWKRGRELRLAFSAATGPILVDPETSGRIPIIGGLDSRHPLDLMLHRNLEIASDTISIAEAYAINSRRWETEIERLYDAAANDTRVSEAVRSAERSWKEFSQLQFKAAGALNALPAGTIWTISQAQFVHSLRRSHALSLTTLQDAVRSAVPASPPGQP